jgi:hypothetical protein
VAKSAKELKREMNEEHAARFARRSKQRRKAERARRVDARERRWLSAVGVEVVEKARPARAPRGRRRSG